MIFLSMRCVFVLVLTMTVNISCKFILFSYWIHTNLKLNHQERSTSLQQLLFSIQADGACIRSYFNLYHGNGHYSLLQLPK